MIKLPTIIGPRFQPSYSFCSYKDNKNKECIYESVDRRALILAMLNFFEGNEHVPCSNFRIELHVKCRRLKWQASRTTRRNLENGGKSPNKTKLEKTIVSPWLVWVDSSPGLVSLEGSKHCFGGPPWTSISRVDEGRIKLSAGTKEDDVTLEYPWSKPHMWPTLHLLHISSAPATLFLALFLVPMVEARWEWHEDWSEVGEGRTEMNYEGMRWKRKSGATFWTVENQNIEINALILVAHN